MGKMVSQKCCSSSRSYNTLGFIEHFARSSQNFDQLPVGALAQTSSWGKAPRQTGRHT